MDEQRLQAYLSLIKALLSYPSGEQLALLRSHESLVDADFVRVMKRVATQMAADGEQGAADYLRDLAAQLSVANVCL